MRDYPQNTRNPEYSSNLQQRNPRISRTEDNNNSSNNQNGIDNIPLIREKQLWSKRDESDE